MKLSKLVTSTSPIDQPQGTYPKAYNILLNKAKGAVTNDEGFEEISFLESRDIVHLLPIDDDRIVIFSVSSDTGEDSQISVLDIYGNHEVIVTDSVFGFDRYETYDSLYLRNFKQELFILWTSTSSGTKILNLDDLPFELDDDKKLIDSTKISLIDMVPGFDPAVITMTEEQGSGGELLTGVYYFTSVYEMEDGTVTPAGHMVGPVSITSSSKNDSFINFTGDEPGITSGNSIRLTVSDLDQRYKYIRIIVVKKINGTTTAHYIYKKLIDTDEFTFSYLGNEVHEDLTLEEVLSEPVIYDAAKTLAYADNRLYRGNLKGNALKEYNYQPYANNVKIRWVTEEVNVNEVEGSYKDPYTIFTKRGFFPDEVYAFYIRLFFTNGSRSDAFHIPGPSAEDVDPYIKGTNGGFSVLDKVSDILSSSTVKNYRTPYSNESVTSGKEQLQNDAEISDDVRFFHTRETAFPRNNLDNMGVWYNQDEFYSDDPDIWGDLAGQQVRHHKFPAMDTFIDSDAPIISGAGINKLSVSNSSDLFLTIDKLSTREGWNKGQGAAVPLTVKSSSDAAVQGQESIVDDDGVTTLYHKCGYVRKIDVSYYDKMKSNYSGLFFYNQAKADKTIVVDYDISWVYSLIDGGYYNKDARYRLTVLHFKRESSTYNYAPYKDGDEVKQYILDTFTDVEDYANIIRNHTGSLTIDVVKGDSLSLVLEVFQPDDTGDDPISINSHFYKADIEVKDYGTTTTSTRKARVLGIQAFNVEIPEDMASKVSGYEILYAKRDLSSMRIVGQSLLFGSAQHPLDPSNIGSHAGNHLTTIRSDEDDTLSYVPYLRDDLVRFHAFDIMKDKPAVQPSFIKVGARLKTTLTDIKTVKSTTTSSFASAFTDADIQEKTYFDPDEAEEDGRLDKYTPIQAHYKADFVKSGTDEAQDPVKEYDRLRAVSNFKYVPADGIIGYDTEIVNNSYSEECALVKVSHPLIGTNEGKATNSWLPSNPDFYHDSASNNDADMYSDYFLGSLYLHKTNLYSNVFEQELVSTGKILKTNGRSGIFSSANLFGGDTFFSLYGIRLTAALYKSSDQYLSINRYEALKTIYYFPCYTVANVNLRHVGDTYLDSFYPQVGTSYSSYKEWLYEAADSAGTNKFYYNTDYTSLNDLMTGSPFDQEEEFLYDFPYRVVRSAVYSPEDKEFSLRNFSANDYMEMPKHRGPMENIAVMGSSMLIHMRHSLYQTVTKDTISTTTTELVLGTGDIFRMEPTEVLTTEEGYAGTSHLSACTITPAGYLFVDHEQGKLFLFNGKLTAISSIDNKNLFKDSFKLELYAQLRSKGKTLSNIDNAGRFAGIGYNITYDPKWDRIIVSKKDYVFKDIDSQDLDMDVTHVTAVVFREGRLKIAIGSVEYEIDDAYMDEFFERRDLTMSFDIDSMSWVCMHNYTPDILVSTRNNVLSAHSGSIYRHNIEGTYAKYYGGEIFPSFVDAVFNTSPKVTKQLQSLQWISEVHEDGTALYNSTISKILIFNSYQNSGYVEMEPFVNCRNIEGTWSSNAFRDIIKVHGDPVMLDGEPNEDNLDPDKEWYEKKRIVDKFMVVRFLYSNIDQNALYLYEVLASVLKSNR